MKLLIIDDKSIMYGLIQKQFNIINNKFTIENTLFFQNKDVNELEIKSLKDASAPSDCSFSGYSSEDIIAKVDALIDAPENENELFFVLIDMCLKKDIIGNYDITDYYEYKEICADIYIHLFKRNFIAGKEKKKKTLFAIYSRSETFISVISKVLLDKYMAKHESLGLDKNADMDDFPYACCLPNNITWFTSLWRPKDKDCINKINDNYPLNLPKKLCKYIEGLTD